MALQGNPRTLRALRNALKRLPITVSARIAARSAPDITGFALQTFDAGQTAYGTARPRAVSGAPLTLTKSGAFRDAIDFVATGRDIRLRRLPRYGGYLIGLYEALPNGPLPAAYRDRMTEIAAQEIYRQLFGAGEGA
jgi:hypothetical protein